MIQTGSHDRTAVVQRAIVDQMGRASLPLIVIGLIALIQGIRFGFGERDYLLLLAGAVLSVITMFFFGLLEVLKAAGRRKQAWMFFAAIGGIVPYVFALYLMGVRGLWELRVLSSGVDARVIASSTGFLILGYWLLRSYWRLTEIKADRLAA